MLNFIYYPVSFILWCWHWVYGHIFGEARGITWVLAIMFLTFTVRAIMFKPFVNQVRSMRKMQEFAPELKKIQKKYANDRQKQAQEMQKLQQAHGFNPLGGCLPMLLQIPVFIGLNWVLRAFTFVPPHSPPGFVKSENYFFSAQGVQSYTHANVFGAHLSDFIAAPGLTNRPSVIIVTVPLMILASALTHLTARHSVQRQNPDAATPQTAMMNKITLYLFPLGVLVFGAFFPLGLLIYWLSNNAWTLMQQRVVYKKIDAEEAEKKTAAVEKRTALAPKPGQKPVQQKKGAAKPAAKPEEKSGEPQDAPPKKSPNGTAAKDGEPQDIPGLVRDKRGKNAGRKRR